MTATVERRGPARLPLLFSFQRIVAGNGFIAQLSMDGRALLEREGDEDWITGVAPVGWTEGGATRQEAFLNFRRGWELLIDDIAESAGDSAAFEAALRALTQIQCESLATQWEAARQELRASEFTDPQLTTREAAVEPVAFRITVVDTSNATPELNVQGSEFSTAA